MTAEAGKSAFAGPAVVAADVDVVAVVESCESAVELEDALERAETVKSGWTLLVLPAAGSFGSDEAVARVRRIPTWLADSVVVVAACIWRCSQNSCLSLGTFALVELAFPFCLLVTVASGQLASSRYQRLQRLRKHVYAFEHHSGVSADVDSVSEMKTVQVGIADETGRWTGVDFEVAAVVA